MDRSSSIFLTKRVVDAAKAREGRYHLWDIKLAGFGLRVETSGTKTFVVRYRADRGVSVVRVFETPNWLK